jgi:hypothetical protein
MSKGRCGEVIRKREEGGECYRISNQSFKQVGVEVEVEIVVMSMRTFL